uniref:Uncharacterized protein n=1 Tax=Siphoviridae sp. ctzCL6 TaxID=2827978 RepID=A0A8S5S5F0_9CAUD|nr:MAG TPA: hypothetical protein [Siphoviridae sp. ctzCL6]
MPVHLSEIQLMTTQLLVIVSSMILRWILQLLAS